MANDSNTYFLVPADEQCRPQNPHHTTQLSHERSREPTEVLTWSAEARVSQLAPLSERSLGAVAVVAGSGAGAAAGAGAAHAARTG